MLRAVQARQAKGGGQQPSSQQGGSWLCQSIGWQCQSQLIDLNTLLCKPDWFKLLNPRPPLGPPTRNQCSPDLPEKKLRFSDFFPPLRDPFPPLQPYIEHFADQKEKLVYLTADSENELEEVS